MKRFFLSLILTALPLTVPLTAMASRGVYKFELRTSEGVTQEIATPTGLVDGRLTGKLQTATGEEVRFLDGAAFRYPNNWGRMIRFVVKKAGQVYVYQSRHEYASGAFYGTFFQATGGGQQIKRGEFDGTYFSPVEGDWVRNCHAHEKGSTRESVTFGKSRMSFSMSQSAKADCSTPGFSFEWEAFYEIYGNKPGVLPIDFKLLGLTAIAHTEEVAAQFSAIDFCGHDTWVKGEKMDVAGRKCGENQLGQVGYQAYNLIGLEGAKMKIDFNASKGRSQDRPTAVSDVEFYKWARPL